MTGQMERTNSKANSVAATQSETTSQRVNELGKAAEDIVTVDKATGEIKGNSSQMRVNAEEIATQSNMLTRMVNMFKV